MAASSNASKILCKARNSARVANILDSEDSDQLQNLIIDYFSTPSAENGDEVSDEDDCEGENELVNSEDLQISSFVSVCQLFCNNLLLKSNLKHSSYCGIVITV